MYVHVHILLNDLWPIFRHTRLVQTCSHICILAPNLYLHDALSYASGKQPVMSTPATSPMPGVREAIMAAPSHPGIPLHKGNPQVAGFASFKTVLHPGINTPTAPQSWGHCVLWLYPLRDALWFLGHWVHWTPCGL